MSTFDVVQWKPYPADVPMDQRQPCEMPECGCPGEMLQIEPGRASITMPRAGATHVFCREHAGPAGLDEWLASAAPEKLTVFDRLVLRLSGRSDLIPPRA